MPPEHEERHSEIYFGPQRDFWWNRDHLRLLADRWGLREVRSMLDVGSGVGHWGMTLLGLLAEGATLQGVDREPEWVAEATARAASAGVGDRCRYRVGVATELPFDDGAFDLVTCQTLLIHVEDPLAVLREMARVTRPGGLIVASEPNNRVHLLVDDTERAGLAIEDRIDEIRFYLTCESGKVALGEGHNSIGDVLPAHFAAAGLTGITAHLSDKASLILPPYASEEQAALAGVYREEAAEGRWGWERDQARRYFLAGGGAEDAFDREWEARVASSARAGRAVEEERLATAGGGLLYVVAGRRPG
jgi:SAM-dependent methyltransferase